MNVEYRVLSDQSYKIKDTFLYIPVTYPSEKIYTGNT